MAETMLKEVVVCKATGLQVKKVHRGISWEEVNERWFKGLCMFCDELETPDHHLCHKNSGILMVDCDEDQTRNDEELVETEVTTELSGIEDRAVENEANEKVVSAIVKEESIPQFLMVTEADSTCVQNTNVILQQVSISPLEHSLNFCKANLDVMGNYQYTMGKTHQIWSHSSFGCVNDDACQVFDVIPVRTKVLPKEHKKRFHKSWRFKFKDMVQPREFIQGKLVVQEAKVTRNQLRSLIGIVDDLRSDCGSDIWCVQYLVSSVVVGGLQETQWLFNDELEDIQKLQILIKEGINSYVCPVFNGICLRSHILHQQKKPKSFLEIEVMREDVQHVLWDFLHMKAIETRYALRECDEICEVARDVSKRSMLGLTFGIDNRIRESNAGQEQQAVCEQIIMVNVWLYQISLVLQQVMRNKKIKFSKRWWFKYKEVKEGIQRLQIQLRYKSWLEFEERFKSWSRGESWRQHKTMQLQGILNMLFVMIRPESQEILSKVKLLLKNSLVITGSWRRFMMVKGCPMLEHASREAERHCYQGSEQHVEKLHSFIGVVGDVLFHHSHGLSNRLHRQGLQDLQLLFTLGEVKFKGKGREVREELSYLTSREIQEDSSHYFLLVAAANQSHIWSTGYHVWHRWKAHWFFVGMISTMWAWLFGEGGFDIVNEARVHVEGRD